MLAASGVSSDVATIEATEACSGSAKTEGYSWHRKIPYQTLLGNIIL